MAKSELILALEMIEREKGIKKDEILKMIEGAVVIATSAVPAPSRSPSHPARTPR